MITLIARNTAGASVEYTGKTKAEALRNFKAVYNTKGFKFQYTGEEQDKIIKSYIGSWSANNGGTNSYGSEGMNKSNLAKEMREICAGNVFKGNTGRWAVYEVIEGERSEEPVMSGTVRN